MAEETIFSKIINKEIPLQICAIPRRLSNGIPVTLALPSHILIIPLTS